MVRVHAEDGDKGVPREIVYGLVSEGNPFTPFFNISETSGERTIAFKIMPILISFDGKKETLKKTLKSIHEIFKHEMEENDYLYHE